jgi:hypothetical protein
VPGQCPCVQNYRSRGGDTRLVNLTVVGGRSKSVMLVCCLPHPLSWPKKNGGPDLAQPLRAPTSAARASALVLQRSAATPRADARPFLIQHLVDRRCLLARGSALAMPHIEREQPREQPASGLLQRHVASGRWARHVSIFLISSACFPDLAPNSWKHP